MPRERRPAASGISPSSALDQRGLAAAVVAGDRDPVAPGHRQVDRAEPEPVAGDLGPVERRHHGGRLRARGDRVAQLPLLARLLHHVQPIHRLPQPGRLRRLPVGARLVLLAHVLVRLAAAGDVAVPLRRPVVAAPGLGDQVVALPGVRLVGLAGLPARQLPRGDVLGPAAGVVPDPLLGQVELHDVGGDPVQEAAVVAGDQDRTLVAGDELDDQREPARVEVVGRLVQQQHVVPAEQHGDQRGPRGLTAGEAAERPVGGHVQAHLRGHLRQPVLEVGRAEREPAVQRRGVLLVGAGPALGQGRGGVVEVAVGGRHAGPPPGVLEQRLGGVRHHLGEPPDGGVAGSQPDGAGLDRQLADDGAHQRGLAGAVGPDDGGDVAVGEHQVEAAEEGARGEADVEAGDGEGGGHGCSRSDEGPRAGGRARSRQAMSTAED